MKNIEHPKALHLCNVFAWGPRAVTVPFRRAESHFQTAGKSCCWIFEISAIGSYPRLYVAENIDFIKLWLPLISDTFS